MLHADYSYVCLRYIHLYLCKTIHSPENLLDKCSYKTQRNYYKLRFDCSGTCRLCTHPHLYTTIHYHEIQKDNYTCMTLYH